MPTAHKAEVVEKTKERYARSTSVLFTEYRGLGVKQLQELRAELKTKGGEMQVVKNTLFKLAAGEDAEKLPTEMTSGPTAITFVYENESDCAKTLVDFTKKNKAFVVKGGLVAGSFYDADAIKALSELPPREVLIAQVIGAIAAPLTTLVGTIEALYAAPIRTIGAVADKIGEGGSATTSESSSPEATASDSAPEEAAPESSPEEPAPVEEAAQEESAEATTETEENKE